MAQGQVVGKLLLGPLAQEEEGQVELVGRDGLPAAKRADLGLGFHQGRPDLLG